ncbi:2-oxo-4-hydroxy-4-carboxy-5-ureidoimidazoline decarboxylase [Paenibacillus phyllosphaerae]|uniref:2-oxo-4-hydroxy-4-carboxy-5-ureidoimidazoline decarboxylase n=1 Tax=Paenibacillus phyllosphaerae TaxID=274593 RepID=A0A7W5ATH3_9BACL|nr:2-oxo-4-hydroxy-4-carboxy-5-ureidoimidazoline decarboxylase [Paenibacillus phyllosphaerae]MBB3108484.1 2-oxo-4-hydroxy-4-carboxy-5-ureidoimidazoline decarboxylase [Paenibacillus phyllosphaerae]
MKKSMSELNALSQEEFASFLSEVFENSPWVAEQAAAGRPYETLDELHAAMLRIVKEAPNDEELAFIRRHPNLATRLSVGENSAKEQQGVGLDRLTPEEFEWFTRMNDTYMEKFGFPFIFAVRGRTRADIEEAMKVRINNAVDEERAEAIRQITRITRLRLDDLIEG